MTIQFELWHLVLLAAMILGAFWRMAKYLLDQAREAINEKFAGLNEHLKKQDEHGRLLERQLNDLRIELPRDYVRREDYTQAIATIMTKIDGVALRVETSMRALLEKLLRVNQRGQQ